MAISGTPAEAQAPFVACAQLTSASGTTETSGLVSAGTNGTRITEIRVISGAEPAVAPGTVLLLKLYDGTTSRAFASAVCPGGADLQQALFSFGNSLVLPNAASLRIQLRTGLPSGGVLDVTFYGVSF